MARLLLKHVRIAADSPEQLFTVAIAEGRVFAVGPSAPSGFAADQVFDAQGAWLLPGLIDLRANLRQPGYEHKATLASELRAALYGGVTTVCCLPETRPVNDTPAVTRLISDLAAEAGPVRVRVLGALTQKLAGEQLSEMSALRSAGCIALTNSRAGFASLRTMKRCLEYACSLDIPVLVLPEEPSLAAEGCVHDGPVASRLGLGGIPASAETLAVAQWLMLAAETEARIHLGGLSSRHSIPLLAEARRRGVRVTADVSLANLMFTDVAVDGFDDQYHVRPPLRSEQDRDALRQALLEGIIDALAAQHEPHDEAARQAPFAETEPGMSQFDTWLPQLWSLADEQPATFLAYVHAASARAAQVLDLPAGSIEPGGRADLCLFDPHAEWIAQGEQWYSAGCNTPWYGQRQTGRVTATLVNGKLWPSARVPS